MTTLEVKDTLDEQKPPILGEASIVRKRSER